MTFKLQNGVDAVQGEDGKWYEPSVNPFGLGCCDCGLYHQVEWRIVNRAGDIVHEGYMQKLRLQLRMDRDVIETERLRHYKAPSAASELEELRAEVARIREALGELVSDIEGLISESSGVYGLHLNGDPSPWEELEPGGRFERLTGLVTARAALGEGRE